MAFVDTIRWLLLLCAACIFGTHLAFSGHTTTIAGTRKSSEQVDSLQNNILGIPGYIPPGYKVEIREGGRTVDTHIPCAVECWWSKRSGLVTKYTVVGKKWKVLYSMEGPQYYPQLRRQELDTARAVTSMSSDVPVPYIANIFDMQNVSGSVFDHAIDRASFIATNCASKNGRESIVRALMQVYPVDALSSCLNNVDSKLSKRGNWGGDKAQIMRKYKFHLAFENQCENDYVTEKVWLSLMSGTLPVYYGAPNIKKLVPQNSMLHYTDFHTVEHLAAHLRYLQSNKTAYDSYHEWRRKPLEDSLLETYKHTNEHVQCRICKWVAARDLKLKWNRHLQDIMFTQTESAKIPMLLHQTSERWGDKKTFSFREESARLYREDGWSYVYWSDADVDEFVSSGFPQYYERWKNMTPYIRKLDTVRYMWMHRYGGVYLDADAECVRKASSFVKGLPEAPTAWIGGFPEPFFLMSTPGNDFWLFVIEHILEHWKHSGTRDSSGPQGLNRWAKQWVERHGLHIVRLFEMHDATEARSIDDGRTSPSWRWYVPASQFMHLRNTSSTHKIGFLPNEVIDPTACFGKREFGSTKYNHCTTVHDALFVHHCQGSHGL